MYYLIFIHLDLLTHNIMSASKLLRQGLGGFFNRIISIKVYSITKIVFVILAKIVTDRINIKTGISARR